MAPESSDPRRRWCCGPPKRSEGLRPLGGRPTKPGTARPLIRGILALDVLPQGLDTRPPALAAK